MIGLIVTSHGKFADGLLDAVGIIIGDQKDIECVSLHENDELPDFELRMLAAIDKLKKCDGILILADVFGATPANIGVKIALENKRVEVIAGVNLPILLELAINKSEIKLNEAVDFCIKDGRESVVDVKKFILSGGSKDE